MKTPPSNNGDKCPACKGKCVVKCPECKGSGVAQGPDGKLYRCIKTVICTDCGGSGKKRST